MAATKLLDAADNDVVFQAGESGNIYDVVFSFAGTPIVKLSLVSLTVDLFDRDSNTVLNSRSNQNILDANGGAVTTDGVLTLKLGPSDNAIVGTVATGAYQTHCARFRWSWIDLESVVRYGIQEFDFVVEKIQTPV